MVLFFWTEGVKIVVHLHLWKPGSPLAVIHIDLQATSAFFLFKKVLSRFPAAAYFFYFNIYNLVLEEPTKAESSDLY